MKKTAVVLSVVFLVLGFVGIWAGAYFASAMCFVFSVSWLGIKSQLDTLK